MSYDKRFRAYERGTRHRLRLLRLYQLIHLISRTWQRIPLIQISGVIAAGAVIYYIGFSNIAGYIPTPYGVYRFFWPAKHGCSQTYYFKTHHMVWVDDGSPADPPLPGYTWDALKCAYVAPQQIWLRRY